MIAPRCSPAGRTLAIFGSYHADSASDPFAEADPAPLRAASYSSYR